MKQIEKLSLEDIEKIEYMEKEELRKLSFLELCMYYETLNKIKARRQSLTDMGAK